MYVHNQAHSTIHYYSTLQYVLLNPLSIFSPFPLPSLPFPSLTSFPLITLSTSAEFPPPVPPTSSPPLPLPGILMKDLCATQMTSTDYSKEPNLPHHVNLDKYDTLLNIFSLIKHCHKVYPPTKVDPDFMRI